MIFAIVAALAAAAPAACPDAATPEASTCRALQAVTSGEHAAAAEAFEQAAAAGDASQPATARAWAAAGNMWIAAGEPGKAALALDRALAGNGLQAEQRGEALLDRARAAEAQNDLKTARAKVAEAAQTISDQPFLWYFSAALAIRDGNVAEARSAINRALSLAPNDAAVLFEAGHVAHFADDFAGARAYWTRALQLDPNGASGKAAAEALKLLDGPSSVQSEAREGR